MIDIKNVLEAINETVVIPITVLTFFLLMYILFYLRNKDRDVIRSRIFLKYDMFKRSFMLLAIFGMILVIHVSLIYVPHFFTFDVEYYSIIADLQRVFGLFLTIILCTFVYYTYKVIK